MLTDFEEDACLKYCSDKILFFSCISVKLPISPVNCCVTMGGGLLASDRVNLTLDMRYERITAQRRPACDNAARCNSCPELGGNIPGPVRVHAVYQRLSWLACMAAHDDGDDSVLLSL